MPSLLAVSGLLIDRAFPPLEASAAAQRRALTMSAVVNITRIARDRQVDAIVVVGGLFEDRSVGVQALPAALSILSSFGGPVLIAPGARDPYTTNGPYGTTVWSDGIHVWSSPEFTESPAVSNLRVIGRAAATGWGGGASMPDDAAPPMVVAAEGLAIELATEWAASRYGRHAITTGDPATSTGQVTVLEPVNADLGHPFGKAALLEIHPDGAVQVERTSVLDGEPGTVIVDITGARDDDSLRALVANAARAAEPWSVVKLTGALAQGVLLPSTAGWKPGREQVVVDESEVEFEFTDPNASDRTALAEFLRSIAAEPAHDRTRHQATAFGLAALTASAREWVEP